MEVKEVYKGRKNDLVIGLVKRWTLETKNNVIIITLLSNNNVKITTIEKNGDEENSNIEIKKFGTKQKALHFIYNFIKK